MKDIEKEILQVLDERGWGPFAPADLAKSIAIESAELLELFQWGSPTMAEVKKDKEKMEALKHELADVLIYALQLSAFLDLDIKKIIRDKLEYNRKKYPVKLVRGNDDHYYRIKKEYRAKGK